MVVYMVGCRRLCKLDLALGCFSDGGRGGAGCCHAVVVGPAAEVTTAERPPPVGECRVAWRGAQDPVDRLRCNVMLPRVVASRVPEQRDGTCQRLKLCSGCVPTHMQQQQAYFVFQPVRERAVRLFVNLVSGPSIKVGSSDHDSAMTMRS